MSHYYQQETVDMLHLFSEVDSFTVTALAQRLGVSREVSKNKIKNLHTKDLIDSRRNTVPAYFITAKGKRILASIDKEDSGVMPEPRSHVGVGPYKPTPIPTRPGSDAFLAVPSLRGEERVPHRLPISMAGGQA